MKLFKCTRTSERQNDIKTLKWLEYIYFLFYQTKSLPFFTYQIWITNLVNQFIKPTLGYIGSGEALLITK